MRRVETTTLKTQASIIVLYLLATTFALCQEDKSPTVEFLLKRGYTFPDSRTKSTRSDQWPDTLYYNTAYKSTLLGSPTIPISFSRMEYKNGTYVLTPSLSIGYGYEWFFGQFIFNENDKIIIDPTFSFGVIADVGLRNDFNLDRLAGIFAGGFIGFSALSMFFGYDFILQAPTFGMGGRIDLYTVFQNALTPIGNVVEVRRHKGVAPVIGDE